MNLLYEDMLRIEANGLVCRIWRQTDGPFTLSNAELKARAVQLMWGDPPLLRPIARQIIECSGINSVEVIHRDTGDGICIHKDWP